MHHVAIGIGEMIVTDDRRQDTGEEDEFDSAEGRYNLIKQLATAQGSQHVDLNTGAGPSRRGTVDHSMVASRSGESVKAVAALNSAERLVSQVAAKRQSQPVITGVGSKGSAKSVVHLAAASSANHTGKGIISGHESAFGAEPKSIGTSADHLKAEVYLVEGHNTPKICEACAQAAILSPLSRETLNWLGYRARGRSTQQCQLRNVQI